MINKSEMKTGGRTSLPKEDELVRLPIQLTRAQAARLKALADAGRMNISGLVRAAVDSFLGSEAPGRIIKAGRITKDGEKPGLTQQELEELLKNR
jgi:hypothetical protein